MNEQESSILRMKIDDLEKERKELKLQIVQLQKDVNGNNKTNGISTKTFENQINKLETELSTLKINISDKDKTISNLQTKIAALENEIKQHSRINVDLTNTQDLLKSTKKEKESLTLKLNTILNTKIEDFPNHSPKIPTDLTPKSHLKKWVIELENEVQILTGLLKTNIDAKKYETEYEKVQEKCIKLELELSKLTNLFIPKKYNYNYFIDRKSDNKAKTDGLENENLKLNNELSKIKIINRGNEVKLQTQTAKVNKIYILNI